MNDELTDESSDESLEYSVESSSDAESGADARDARDKLKGSASQDGRYEAEQSLSMHLSGEQPGAKYSKLQSIAKRKFKSKSQVPA